MWDYIPEFLLLPREGHSALILRSAAQDFQPIPRIEPTSEWYRESILNKSANGISKITLGGGGGKRLPSVFGFSIPFEETRLRVQKSYIAARRCLVPWPQEPSTGSHRTRSRRTRPLPVHTVRNRRMPHWGVLPFPAALPCQLSFGWFLRQWPDFWLVSWVSKEKGGWGDKKDTLARLMFSFAYNSS